MDVADDVKRAVLLLQVVPQRLSFNFRRIHFFGRAQNVDSPKTFAFQDAERPTQLLGLLADNMRTESLVQGDLGSARGKVFPADQIRSQLEDSDTGEPSI